MAGPSLVDPEGIVVKPIGKEESLVPKVYPHHVGVIAKV
jgi:hypothetical protein